MDITQHVRNISGATIKADRTYKTLDIEEPDGVTINIWFRTPEQRAALLKAAQELAAIDGERVSTPAEEDRICKNPGNPDEVIATFDGEKVTINRTTLTFGLARWLAMWLIAATQARNGRRAATR